MFAIIQTSGRQFRVEPGAVIAIDGHNAGEAGGEVSFDQVLLVSNDAGDVTAGTPFVPAPRCSAWSASSTRARRSASSRRSGASSTVGPKGHRSPLTRVRITDIQVR